MKSLVHYRAKLRDRGVGELIAGRLRWYQQSLQIDNWWIGRYVELTGNRVDLDGVTLSLDNPLVTTRHKSTIYFGIYEVGERQLTKRFIDRSLPTVEIGGSIGGVACTTNRLLHDPKAHVVLECNPMVLPTLEENRALNHCGFSVEPSALAYGSDTISFGVCPNHFMMGRLFGDGEQIIVPTITLGKILDKHGFETINLISDSEGAEVEMVENEGYLLRDRVKWIVMETHAAERGRAAIGQMFNRLRALGFDVAHQDADKPVYALRNRQLT
jgi:FkbM family methyltransferase